MDSFIADLVNLRDFGPAQPATRRAATMVGAMLPVLRLWHFQRGTAAVNTETWSTAILSILSNLQTLLATTVHARLYHGCDSSDVYAPQSPMEYGPGLSGPSTGAGAGHLSDAPSAEALWVHLSEAALVGPTNAGQLEYTFWMLFASLSSEGCVVPQAHCFCGDFFSMLTTRHVARRVQWLA